MATDTTTKLSDDLTVPTVTTGHTMNVTNAPPARLALAFFLAVWLLSGCSGSGSTDSQPLSDTNGSVTVGDDASTNDDNSGDTTGETTTGTTGETVNDDGSQTSTEADNQVTQNSTQVNFNITVPVYVSDALQVQVVWGDSDIRASWITDETWAATVELPAGVENLLVVSFHDANGAITLGTFETQFNTGTGPSTDYQVTADQFDTDRWDNDSDGVSNLDELIAGSNPLAIVPLAPVTVSLELVADKTFRLSWQPSSAASFYRILENPDGIGGFTQVGNDIDASTQTFDHRVALYNRVNARYIVQACDANGCVDSDEQIVSGSLERAIGYFKASNPDGIGLLTHENGDAFGRSVALSADGNTLAVGAPYEDSHATGINGDQGDSLIYGAGSGAVYVFARVDGSWKQQAYVKASNTGKWDYFGSAISLNANGDTLVVGAYEQGNIGGAYVFFRDNGNWREQAYLTASHRYSWYRFGQSVSLSADGNIVAVGAPNEDGASTGINGDQTDTSANSSGAVYIFARSGDTWQEQAYIKSSNSEERDQFGWSVSLSADGSTLAASAINEQSAATGTFASQDDNSLDDAGAVYLFTRTGDSWKQHAYIKSMNTYENDRFGISLSLSADGNTLAVKSNRFSGTTVIEGSGAIHLLSRNNGAWQHKKTITARDVNSEWYNSTVTLSGDGNTLGVGSPYDVSGATGLNGDSTDTSAQSSGAAFVFKRTNGDWSLHAYLKASNTDAGDSFGAAVSLSSDGNSMAVGASLEGSAAVGINGDQQDNSAASAGAVYLY